MTLTGVSTASAQGVTSVSSAMAVAPVGRRGTPASNVKAEAGRLASIVEAVEWSGNLCGSFFHFNNLMILQ